MTSLDTGALEAARLTDIRLQEILDGCSGVTDGPWELEHVGEICGVANVHSHRDALHLVRLDPKTVHLLVTEVIASRSATPNPARAAEDMREAAKKVCADYAAQFPTFPEFDEAYNIAGEIARRIAALPLSPGGEQR